VHFVAIPTPRVADIPAQGLPKGPGIPGISQLQFADALDGFADGARLYDTHNGGSSWHQVSLGGYVMSLAVGGGDVYAVVYSRLTGSSGRLMRSPVGKDAWVALPAAGKVDSVW
jgi:hypothetical protein